MQFHQIVVSASAGDAITTAAFELRNLLRQVGPSEVFALYIDPRLGDEVKPLADMARRRSEKLSDDVVIFHASIGEPDVTRFVASRPERLVVMYHNISPPERFLPFDPKFAGLLAAGRIELGALADKAVLALTVSQYNAAELAAVGFRNVVVVPLVVDLQALRSVEPHAGVANHLDMGIEGPVVLFVGQLLPHKRPELLIEAYDVLVTHLIPKAHLIMVGTPRLPRFHTYLEYQLQELNLNRAWLAGSVSQQELVAFYRGASVFVTMSEHEGFCVPVLEAMGFDLPVIARAAAAVPETVGDAAVLLPMELDNPTFIAEAMAEVITCESLRAELVERGRRRVTLFNPDVARAEMLDAVLQVAIA